MIEEMGAIFVYHLLEEIIIRNEGTIMIEGCNEEEEIRNTL
jgi:hypothetical protein